MPINSAFSLPFSCRISATQSKGAKNLVEVEPENQRAAGATKPTEATAKGKLVEFTWWMNKQGYAKASIRGYLSCLRTLWKRGANIYDPESIKDVMAKQKWSANRKRNAINAYSLFLKMEGLTWEKPRCKVTRTIPFIPTEEELDALIAGCGKKTATFLRLLKETAMRSGEAKRLLWTNIDSKRQIITLNEPEKGSNPRAWRVSSELIGMLNALPKKSLRIFGDGPINSQKTTFYKARRRLAHKLQNPRLLRISFHTFRHWKATTLYHQTKDIYYVKEFLGHKRISSTEIYITLERTIFESSSDDYTVKVAKEPEEIKGLLEIGFEYVCEKEDLVFLRKRK
jgi:integrase